MFYDLYDFLCKQAQKKPYTVAKEIGLTNSNVAQWKKGSTPRPEVIKKIADYFGVSVEFLLEQKEKPSADGEELIGVSKKTLIEKIKCMDDEQIEALSKIIDAVDEMKSKKRL